ncbi:MAG TPA: hypothetical protein VGM14_03625 [Streptosporangiaceae bacterium]|jgi:hypothetical protein
MNELEYELRELFQGRVEEAERPVNLLPAVRRRASQSVRRRVGAGALAGVAVIAAVVLPMVLRQPAASSPSPEISGDHAEPRGWVPVDYGKAQVWVPPSWLVGSYACVGSTTQGVVYVGTTPDASCATPPNVLTLAGPKLNGSARIVRINGMTAKVRSAASGSLSVYVPDLGNMQLTARGPLAIRALGTLRPSPLVTALSGSPQAALPTGFRWHEFGGIKFAAPANWASRHGTVAAACSPSIAPDTVVLSTTPPIGGLLCAPYAPVPAGYLGGPQGIVVIAAPQASPPPARKCIASDREMRRFCAQPPDGLGTVYTLYLQPTGQKKATVMYIGVGGRGRFARKIIDSIRPASGR